LFGRLNPWLNNKRHTTARSLGIAINRGENALCAVFLRNFKGRNNETKILANFTNVFSFIIKAKKHWRKRQNCLYVPTLSLSLKVI